MRRCLCLFLVAALAACSQKSGRFYIAASGDDAGAGSLEHPWRTLAPTRGLHLRPGDAVLLKGGETFTGTLRLDSARGNAAAPVLVGSYGGGDATIAAGDSSALVVYRGDYVSVSGLRLVGAGRKAGNIREGLSLVNCSHTDVDSLDITGFQKSGLMIYASTDMRITHVSAHENGAAGIAVEGAEGKRQSLRIQILDCQADDNPGDPTNLTNHSGNGIVVGHCTHLVIDRCSATNNGWDMPRIGNGPVGIWCYEADSVTIQHCLAYRNKTSPGAADGGGFDLDGGVTNSVIQDCLSYGNQGSGYCIFQYWGASPWHDNIIRNNITENDGTVSDSRAGIYVWNSSNDSSQFYNCQIYNNTVYCVKEAALSFSEVSARKGFTWSNNILVGGDSLIRGRQGTDRFDGNDWWCRFRKGPGLNIDPGFADPGHTSLTSVSGLAAFTTYRLPENSPLKGKGASF